MMTMMIAALVIVMMMRRRRIIMHFPHLGNSTDCGRPMISVNDHGVMRMVVVRMLVVAGGGGGEDHLCSFVLKTTVGSPSARRPPTATGA